jgi:hypothetical protein
MTPARSFPDIPDLIATCLARHPLPDVMESGAVFYTPAGFLRQLLSAEAVSFAEYTLAGNWNEAPTPVDGFLARVHIPLFQFPDGRRLGANGWVDNLENLARSSLPDNGQGWTWTFGPEDRRHDDPVIGGWVWHQYQQAPVLAGWLAQLESLKLDTLIGKGGIDPPGKSRL